MPGSELKAERSASKEPGTTAGKSLKRIFGQDEALAGIESQEAASSLLMNRARLDIFLHLCRNPCSHARSIARDLGRSLNATVWHLKRLLAAGYLEAASSGGRLHYWPAGMVRHEDAEIVARLNSGSGRAVARAILAEGGSASQASIVLAVQESQQTVSARLAVLVKDGAIDRPGNRHGTAYSLSGKTLALASGYRESAGAWSAAVLALLREDGLFPKKPALRGTRLGVQVSLPSGKERLAIECNPLAFLERLLRQGR